MILNVFVVLQISIQVISAQISARDLASQNVLNDLVNTPLAGYGRSRRQINDPPVSLPGNGNVPLNGLVNGLPFKNGMAFDNLPRSNGLPNNYGLPNNSPISSFNFPFSNMNTLPQNRLVSNINGIYNNGLPNGLPGFNNVPNGLPGLNNVPNGLPGFNNVPNELPSFNNVPNELPSFNNVAKGLPSFNNVPNGLPGLNNVANGLPGLNNVPNSLPGLNNVPNELPSFNNVAKGLPSFNNVANGLPGLNNWRNGLSGLNNVAYGLPGLNNVANDLPGFNNVPNVLPGLNDVPNGLPGLNKMPNGLPGMNDVPNGLPNFNNLPVPNKLQNFINVPVENNILNLNNLPAANSMPNPTSFTSFHKLPCGSALPSLPVNNGLPLNNLPTISNRLPLNNLPPISNRLPFLNNFRITDIGIGYGATDITRFPRNNEDGNVPGNANNFQNGNGLTQKVNYQSNNVFSDITNTPSASASQNIVPVDNIFSSVNNLPISNSVASEAQNIQLNNGWLDTSNFQNYNVPYTTPVNEQRFVNNVAINNDFTVADTSPPNTIMPNSRIINVINNGMPLSNEKYLNDIYFANNAMSVVMPETEVKNSDDGGFSGNSLQCGNDQVPESKWHYEFVGANMPGKQDLLPEGEQMLSNMPNDYQTAVVSNNLSLAQELVKKLQIEGLANMPFLNGLPVAGITETVTVLNGPYGK